MSKDVDTFVWFRLRDGIGSEAVDLRLCRRYIAQAPWEEEPQADYEAFYLMPGGRWIRHLLVHRCPIDGSCYEHYSEVDAVTAARAIWLRNYDGCHKLPPELEPLREHAENEGRWGWARVHDDDHADAASVKANASAVDPTPPNSPRKKGRGSGQTKSRLQQFLRTDEGKAMRGVEVARKFGCAKSLVSAVRKSIEADLQAMIRKVIATAESQQRESWKDGKRQAGN